MNRPSQETRERIAAALGSHPVAIRRAIGGYTPAERWLVRCASGTRAFVKLGTTPRTARMLRAEHAIRGSGLVGRCGGTRARQRQEQRYTLP